MNLSTRSIRDQITQPAREELAFIEELRRPASQTPPVLDTDATALLYIAAHRLACSRFGVLGKGDPLESLPSSAPTYFVGLARGIRVVSKALQQTRDRLSEPVTGVYPQPSSRVAVMQVDTAGRNEPLRRLAQILETSGRAVANDPEAKRRFNAAKFDAAKFFAKLSAKLPKPRISVAEDGEVVVEWIGHNGRAVVDFEGDDHFGYALLRNGRFIAGQHAGDLQAPMLPPDLLQYLDELTTAE